MGQGVGSGSSNFEGQSVVGCRIIDEVSARTIVRVGSRKTEPKSKTDLHRTAPNPNQKRR
jgi:hypothetical protein